MQEQAQCAFKVNLAGIIELLSHHLYSGPQVFLRELLQNATDAIQARRKLSDAGSLKGLITVELTEGATPTLTFEDNGIGLTEDEVHQFLATIGLSSKRDELERQREEFIGQFGIGLLSAFLVTDEIVMVTQSARPAEPALEWRGLGSGTYSLRRLPEPRREPGTTVFLRAKTDATTHFARDYVLHHLRNYGGLLPHHIEFVCGKSRQTVNESRPPWEKTYDTPGEWRQAALEYGQEFFDLEFMDCFPLKVPEAGIQGIGYVLPASPSLASRRADRLYLKNMLLADNAEHLLPDWAFFVRCALNATALNPNAAREGLQQDAKLAKAQKGLEQNLRDYLHSLARHDHERLRRLISVHYRAIKVLAADDDEFYRLFIDWLPFESCQGTLSVGEMRKSGREILYAPHIDIFRQLAPVAAAQSVCLINGGYLNDAELLDKLPEVFSELTVRRAGPDDLLAELEEPPLTVQRSVQEQLQQVEEILGKFNCAVEFKSFEPEDLPALFSLDSEAEFQRELRRTKEQTTEFWGGVLDRLDAQPGQAARGNLCLNWRNPVIRRMLRVKQKSVLRPVAELIYVQALLQGHFPLGAAEREVLGSGLTGLMNLALDKPGNPNDE